MSQTCRLPAGTQDQGPEERERIAYLGERLLLLFEAWGYDWVEPPVFEYYETFGLGTPSFAEQRVYRFLDRNGRLLALRPEMTTGIARMVASSVSAGQAPAARFGSPPFRLAYQGPVFRNEPAGTGRPHSFWQAGVEFIGEPGPTSDAEVLALAAAAADGLGFARARIVLGHAGLAWKVLAAAGVDPEAGGRKLRAVFAGRDLVGLRDLLGGPAAELFAGGPYGPAEARSALARLAAISTEFSADAQAVEALLDAVAEHGPLDVALDLALLRDIDYYTGAAFEVLVPGLAEPLGGGGRYDRLLERFGAALPATGFALNLSAAAACSPARRPRRERVAVATAGERDLPLALRAAGKLRDSGCPVEVMPGNSDLCAAMLRAKSRGAGRLLFFEGQAYREIRLARDGAAREPRGPGRQGIH